MNGTLSIVVARIRKVLLGLRLLLQDSDRKPLVTVIAEAMRCAVREREIPSYYCTHLLHKRGAGDIASYVGFRRTYRIRRDLLEPSHDQPYITDKLLFHERLLAHGLPQPELVAATSGRVLRRAEEEIALGSREELAGLLCELAASCPTGAVFVKPVDGNQGKRCFRFERPVADDVGGLWDVLPLQRFLVQEALEQHPALAAVYPYAVNTVRVHTFRVGNGVEALSALLRTGRGGSVVDNISAGGIFAPLDLDTGALGSVAYEFFWNGGATYEQHPDTGYRFSDFTMPMVGELIEVSRRAAPLFDDTFLGWDIAMTAAGPIIVEANNYFHMTMAQIAAGGFRSHPGFARAFAAYV